MVDKLFVIVLNIFVVVVIGFVGWVVVCVLCGFVINLLVVVGVDCFM